MITHTYISHCGTKGRPDRAQTQNQLGILASLQNRAEQWCREDRMPVCCLLQTTITCSIYLADGGGLGGLTACVYLYQIC